MEGEMARSGAGYDWRDYYGHDDINRFLAESASSNDGVEIVNIGRSVEGRAMDVIVFNNAGTDAPIAWIEAGIEKNT
jgi:murein tripeptide amidase MpaA